MRILVLVITTLMLMTSYQNCAPGASDQAINGAGNPSILGMGTNGVGPMGTDTGTAGGEDILPEYFSVAKTLCSK
ncbi:MAG: hypothetical protein KDD37_05705, partial [Bdellovibrionales bacterium]|nr:hypothetical protein [Bdellovibrionales bacterium]